MEWDIAFEKEKSIILNKVKENIRYLIQETTLTPTQFSVLLHFAPNYVCNILKENKDIDKTPSLNFVLRIYFYLKIDFLIFFREKDEFCNYLNINLNKIKKRIESLKKEDYYQTQLIIYKAYNKEKKEIGRYKNIKK